MTQQKLSTPIEQKVIGPHIRHPNPHPQYALAADVAAPIAPSTSTPAAETVGTPGTPGVSTSYARADHIHPMPGAATSANAGFMSAADKARLDSLTAGQVISPLGGALLDIDSGQLVWDIVTYEQVMA